MGTIIHLYQIEIVLVALFILCQMLSCISNIICLIVVRKTGTYNSKNRPRLLMANICVSDTILTLCSWLFRYALITKLHNYELVSIVLQSIQNYLENMSLYVTSITFIIISWDRYYDMTRVFYNPFNTKSTRFLLMTTWLVSALLALPFIIPTRVEYYEYETGNITCELTQINLNLNVRSVSMFAICRAIMTILCEFLIPAIWVTWYSGRLVLAMITVFNDIQTGVGVSIMDMRRQNYWLRCHVTKRLVAVLFIFILKNTAYTVITHYNLLDLFNQLDKLNPCPQSPHLLYYIFSEIFRVTTSLNSFIFFWMSPEFRKQFKRLLKNRNHGKREQNMNTISNMFTNS
ncbi:bombesin receptor subtype-3-like [Oppia nitens]|uniref:bombesin receptor subtype-3-like n=1 Tax=Oppia nitens TaxID=1686743 RepID=UPI0023DC5D1E|nr:bombesin receptor subtype-3-like [Oppia nitens]